MIISVTEYGALPNGRLCTREIQNAIDDCFLRGGGEVVIPKGEYLVGGLRLRSHVTLHLLEDAVLLGSPDPEDYAGYIHDTVEPIPPEEWEKPVDTVSPDATKICVSVIPYSRWNNAVIRGIRATDIAVIGEKGSMIHGQNCYDPQGEEGYRGPHGIDLWFCENITLRGYTIRDCGNWAHAIQNSQRIHLDGVTVLGGHDGFDVRTCDEILVENCRFLTGDDCIAGFDNIGVTVRSCYLESACSWFRFGATDMLVENCRGVSPGTYGFRGSLTEQERKDRADTHENCRHECHNVFLYYCDNRARVRKTPGNILFRNCDFRGCKTVMRLPFGHFWCCNRSLADITFQNCAVTDTLTPSLLQAPEEEPLTFRMLGCTVTTREGCDPIPFAEGTNAKLELTATALTGFTEPYPETL